MALDDCVRLDTRLAGQVRRYHTWPTIKNQSIAEHTWQMIRIYLCVCKKPDPNIMYHIMFHDIGEHYTGDIPYPVKSENKELKERMDMLETRSMLLQLNYWGSFHQCYISDEDRALCKMIELVEMAEFGLDEMVLGNSHGFVIANRCLYAVFNMRPPDKLVLYICTRLNVFGAQYPMHMEGDWWDPIKWEHAHATEHGTHEVSGVDSK